RGIGGGLVVESRGDRRSLRECADEGMAAGWKAADFDLEERPCHQGALGAPSADPHRSPVCFGCFPKSSRWGSEMRRGKLKDAVRGGARLPEMERLGPRSAGDRRRTWLCLAPPRDRRCLRHIQSMRLCPGL